MIMQEATHTHDLPEALRRRIIEYFKYKYRDGKLRNQEAVLQELPYDMQVSLTLVVNCLGTQQYLLCCRETSAVQ